MIYVTRKEHFNAAHRLYNPSWTEEKNKEEFGVCANKNWHGHNYEIMVTVMGEVDSSSGMIINLKTLSKIIREEILDKVDHKNLNLDVPFLDGIITTTENVTIKIWEILEKKLESLKNTNCKLHCRRTVFSRYNIIIRIYRY